MKVSYLLDPKSTALTMALVLLALGFLSLISPHLASAFKTQDERVRSLTPRQREIEKQQLRLSSAEIEERRDAVMILGAMRHVDASRAALPALADPSAIVRATAARTILALPAQDTVAALIPLLADKEEFVRQEAAYALGKTRSRAAVAPLSERLLNDKKAGVRAAAAVALGEIRDESGVMSLIQIISGGPAGGQEKSSQKNRKEKNEFVLRAAMAGLGQIRSRVAVPALVAVLAEENLASDVKREAAHALGLIGDPAAVPALQAASADIDPYLSRTAVEALRRISRSR
ncbi:MAG TPA: HEAT repeat domain-containing protein [Pyrinomonadaceae bacterium]|nr:HEAT repeat domain-containing protein [Pyrinomonadaceae bacterium]